MFISPGVTRYVGTEQRSKGSFLLLAHPDRPEEQQVSQCPWTDQSDPDFKRRCPGSETSWPGEMHTCGVCGKKFYTGMHHPKFTEVRGFVRTVELRQCGHWMMGDMTIWFEGESLDVSLSGCYGNDGLPSNLQRVFWKEGVPLPTELAMKWAKAKGGWNSSGEEGPSIREWAIENEKALRKAGRKKPRSAR